MDNKFKVYCTDEADEARALSLPPGTMPVAFPTEAEALKYAFRALWEDRVVWKIEYPDGFLVTREDIELLFQKHPAGDPLPSLHQPWGKKRAGDGRT